MAIDRIRKVPRISVHSLLRAQLVFGGVIPQRRRLVRVIGVLDHVVVDVQTSLASIAVDELMTASGLHLGPCAKNMVMFAITIALLCCSLFSGSSDACSCIRTNLRGSAGSPRIDAPLVDCITISDARPAWPDRLWIAE